jgi:hypothetical protein
MHCPTTSIIPARTQTVIPSGMEHTDVGFCSVSVSLRLLLKTCTPTAPGYQGTKFGQPKRPSFRNLPPLHFFRKMPSTQQAKTQPQPKTVQAKKPQTKKQREWWENDNTGLGPYQLKPAKSATSSQRPSARSESPTLEARIGFVVASCEASQSWRASGATDPDGADKPLLSVE